MELIGERARRAGAAAPSSAADKGGGSWRAGEHISSPEDTGRVLRIFCQLWKGNSLTAKFGSTVTQRWGGGGGRGGRGGKRCSCNPTQSAEQPAGEAGDARRAQITAEQKGTGAGVAAVMMLLVRSGSWQTEPAPSC